MAFASKHPHSGAEVLNFLRMFQGAAATFAEQNGEWSLWLPEFSADEHPLTPASQIFFPVILRHEEQAFAIRFFYDCSSGKVRYYTSAIPDEISRLPKFENAISELFRHTLPVEPIRQRHLGRREKKLAGDFPLKPRSVVKESLAEPAESALAAKPVPVSPPDPLPARVVQEVSLARPKPTPALASPEPRVPVSRVMVVPPPHGLAPVIEPVAVTPAPPMTPAPAVETVRHVRFEIGPRVRSVMVAFLVTAGIIVMGALAANAYLKATEDPGVMHHRLQLEEMRLRAGR